MDANEARNKFFQYLIKLQNVETEEACEEIVEEFSSSPLLDPIEAEIKDFLSKAEVNDVNKMIANLYVCIGALSATLVLQHDPYAYSPKVKKSDEDLDERMAKLLKKHNLM